MGTAFLVILASLAINLVPSENIAQWNLNKFQQNNIEI